MSTNGTLKYGLRPTVRLAQNISPFAAVFTLKQDDPDGHAKTIAGMSQPSVLMAKEAVNRAYETTLTEGILFERRAFHATFGTEDQKEGMAAFGEKRKPEWRNR